MRIYGNRQLKTLPGRLTRPTTARVREAVFNIWQGEIVQGSWLDLCAGNGAMGAEALCRGAARVVGIERSPQACQIIRQNWQAIATEEQTFEVIRGDIRQKLKSLAGEKFDRIYFDPPYESELYQPVLDAIASLELLVFTGELAVEYNPKFWQATSPPGLELFRQKAYGSTKLAFYGIASTEISSPSSL